MRTVRSWHRILARAKDEEAQWALLYSAQKQHASDLERSLVRRSWIKAIT